MKHRFEFWLRIALLLVVLYTTSFAAFAQSGTKRSNRKTASKSSTPSTVINPELTPAPGTTAAAADTNGQKPELVPQLKKRKRVAIVPAPPPGQIPVYVPEKR